MTKRLAIIGAALSAMVFVATVVRPDTSSEWPPLVQAVAGAAGAFISVWLVLPLIAYIGYLALTPIRNALRRSSRGG